MRFAHLLTVALLALCECLHAANDTWVGNISANWNDLNWTGGNNPPATSGDSLFFGAAGSAGTVLNNDFTSLSVNGITFNAGADAFVMNGNAISLVSVVNNSSSLQTFNTAINLANAVALTSSAGGGNLTFNGVISNTAAHSLTVNGGGTVTLNGDNSYGAGLNTTLNGATTLLLGHDHALGNSTLAFSSSGGAGTVAASAARNISNDIRLNNTGVTGIIGGSHAITFSGNVGVGSGASGTLTVNNTAVTTFSGNVLASAGQTYVLTLNGTGEVNVTGAISNGTAGTVSLIYSGSGKLTLGGANTYSGNTTLSGGGQLNLNNGGVGGTSSSLGTGTLVISGASTIDNTRGSAVTLSTNNAITLTNNTLTFGGSSDLSFGSGGINWQSNNQTINLNGTGSTLAFGGTMTNSHNSTNESFVVNGAGNTLSIGGFTSTNHTGGKNLLLSGSGNVTFTGEINNGTDTSVAVSYTGTGTLSLLGASTYSGNTTLGATGSVVVGNKTAFGIGGTILWNGARLSASTDLTGSNAIANNVTLGATTNTVSGSNSLEFAGSLSTGTSNRTITNNIATGTFTISGTVTVGSGTSNHIFTLNGSGNTVISGNVVNGTTGTVGLTYSGAGLLTLSGANTYTGATSVTSGNLQVGRSSVGQTGSGATLVNGSNAVLSGTGIVRGAATLTMGSIRPGDSGGASIGTLSFANGLTITPSTSITVASLTLGPASGVGDKVEITGALTLNGSSNITVTFDSGYVVQTGDSWTLLDWTGAFVANGFSTGTNLRSGGESALIEGNLDLPDLAALEGYAGQAWAVSGLADGGALTISIVAVPEPGRACLFLVGCFFALGRRRRSARLFLPRSNYP